MTSARFCASCGAALTEGAAFCRACGAAVAGAGERSAPAPLPPATAGAPSPVATGPGRHHPGPPNAGRKPSAGMWIVYGLLFLGGLLYGLYMGGLL